MLEFLNEYRSVMQHIASAVLALAIWRWGGAPERWLIAIFIATMVAPIYLFRLFGVDHMLLSPYAWIYFGTDIAAAIGFTLVAVNANRNYPLWVAGFQLVAFAAHAMKETLDGVSLLAFLILIIGPAYCQLLIILGGFLRHLRRQRRFGPYRDWRLSASPQVAWSAP